MTTGKIEYAAADLANTISGFGGEDRIDFSQVAFASGDHAVDASGRVSVETSAGGTTAAFKVIGPYKSANFDVAADQSGHVLVTYVATGAPTVASPADLLGGYGADFAEAPWGASNPSAFDSWSTVASGSGADPGAFGFRHENHRSLGAAHDAWGVAAGWNGAVGHGPGSGS